MTQRNNLHWGLEDPGGRSLNLTYSYTNNRVTNSGWVYDADGRVTQSHEPETPAAYTFDAAGQLIRSFDDQTDTSSYADGYGKQGKRSTTRCEIDPQHTEDPCEWGTAEVKYYIRSSVLGGEVVSDVNANGSKYRTYVHAAGEVIAWQNLGGTTESVIFKQTDASGMSARSTQSDGSALSGDGYEGAPAELDPMGSNTGLESPYESPIPPDPCPGCGWLGPHEQSNINPNEIEFRLDGMPISQAAGISMAGGLANFQTLMGLISLRWGISGYTISGVRWGTPFTASYSYAGASSVSWGAFNAELSQVSYSNITPIYEISWSLQIFERRRIFQSESEMLKGAVTKAADNTEGCRKYIKDLIEKAAELAGKTKDDIVSTNVEELIEIVLNSRGGGDPKYGGIFLEPAKTTHSAQNYWLWVGNPGFAEVNLSYGTGDGTILSRLATPRAGMATIHELLHVSLRSVSQDTDDLRFANAAAALAGEKPPNFQYDESKPITATNRGINYQASEYWGERLNQACGFPSQITNKMTNHRLY